MDVQRAVANLDGAAALPRKNGELVFQAPWEGRAFGLAVVMNETGAYHWDDFRARLVGEISRDPDDYYAGWLSAFEQLLVSRGIVTEEEIRHRSAEYRALERDPVF